MNEQPKNPTDSADQPVAYDAEGRPLYAHPPIDHQQPPTVVHVARSLEPQQPVMSLERQRLYERSKRTYPQLNLSAGEYVIRAMRRHPIGLIMPLAVGTLLIGFSLAILLNYDLFVEAFSITGVLASASSVAIPILLFVVVIALGMFISYYVYTNNKFFLTNESVIQEIQVSLFSKQEQTVSLSNIEDASYTQRGILQQIFDYGDIRLSTEGDETTYRFSYVANPKNHIATLNDAVEAFKNGRPVGED
ncbi:MAG: PH domain-containing protein [Candidatus Saccharimonadaceae bacterium]